MADDSPKNQGLGEIPPGNKVVYGDPFTVKYGGRTLFFRIVSDFKEIGNRATGTQTFSRLFYTELANGVSGTGEEWQNGDINGNGFKQGGWVQAAATNDRGETWSYETYDNTDFQLGRLPEGRSTGDIILGDTQTVQSLYKKNRIRAGRGGSTGQGENVANPEGSKLYNTVQQALSSLGTNWVASLSEEQLAGKNRQLLAASVSSSLGGRITGPTTVDSQGNLYLDPRFNDPDYLRGPADPTNPNSAAAADPETTIEPVDNSLPELQNNYGDDDKRGRSNQGDGASGLRYPLTITSEQDVIIFQRHTYNPKLSSSIEQYPYLGGLISTVIMGIQSGISDNNSVEWGGSSLNEIERFLSVKSMEAMNPNNSFSDVMIDTVNEGYKKFIKDNPGMYKYYFAQEAVGVQGLLSRAAGSVLNPNLSLLFNGPSLRPFTFTFRMTPRSQREGRVVRSIISQFKEGSAVNTAPGLVFLKAPDVWKIRYAGKAENALHKFKTCALTNMSVNYTPDGSYMTYSDGTMTAYEMTLTFNELDPVYADNYKGLPGDSIGF